MEEYCPDYGTGSCKGGNELREMEDLESEGLVDLLYWRVKVRRKSRMTPRF